MNIYEQSSRTSQGTQPLQKEVKLLNNVGMQSLFIARIIRSKQYNA
jgi:hypothetical protein